MKMKRYGVRPINRPVFALAEGKKGSVSIDDTNALLNKVKAIYSGASGAAKNFLDYIRTKFSIVATNMKGFFKVLCALCAGVTGIAAGNTLGKTFALAAGYANTLILRLKLNPEVKKRFADFFKWTDQRIPLAVLFGSVLTLCLYKFYKLIIKNITSDTEVEESDMKAYRKLAFQKTIIESSVFFDKATKITKSNLFTEADTNGVVIGIVKKAAQKCKEMFDGISKRGAVLIKKHQGIITAILLCIGFVSSFVDIKNVTVAAEYLNNLY